MNPYTPRPGSKVELAIALLAEEGPKNRARLASEMYCEQKNIEASMKTAIDAGYIIRFKDEDGQTKWMLTQTPEPKPAPALFPEQKYHADLITDELDTLEEEFSCAIWSNGELTLHRDGDILATLCPDDILKLRKFLHCFTAPTTL